MSNDSKQCESARRDLAASLGGTDDVMAGSLRHLEGCDSCRAFAKDCQALALTGRGLGQMGSDAAEATVLRLARLAKAHVDAQASEAQPFWRSLPQWGLPALSASVSVAAVILMVGLAGRGERPPDAVKRSNPAGAKGPQGGPVTRAGGVGHLSRLIVVDSDYAADTAIPVDLAVLGDRALAPALRGSGAKGNRPSEKTP